MASLKVHSACLDLLYQLAWIGIAQMLAFAGRKQERMLQCSVGMLRFLFLTIPALAFIQHWLSCLKC